MPAVPPRFGSPRNPLSTAVTGAPVHASRHHPSTRNLTGDFPTGSIDKAISLWHCYPDTIASNVLIPVTGSLHIMSRERQ
jgi:hypothetical protein